MEEDERVELHAGTAGHLGIVVSLVEVGHHITHPNLVAGAIRQRLQTNGSGQKPVDRHVRVPAYGGGEVSVEGSCETVVVVLRAVKVAGAEVQGLGHAAGSHDADELVEVDVITAHCLVQGVCQGLGGRHVYVHLDGSGRLQQRLELRGRRARVPAQHRATREVLQNLLCNCNVRHEHHFLHHIVRVPRLVHADIQGVQRFAVQLELDLGRG
mmetsp:Transcript_12329/g.34623  ORF Transcript_12329/g.34623 Transcript_12329/m.34623 type:complete len:212 (+) Transcript_12329:472-1107(+)